jgi:predicted RNA-binding protein with RPS1 domain
MLQVGQKETFRVIKASKEEHKLGLSLRKEGEEKQRSESRGGSREKFGKKMSKTRAEDMAAVAQQPKAKSLLQIELEKARQKFNNDASSDDE